MEIISFVQDSPRSKSPRLFFSKNNTRKNNNNNYYKQLYDYYIGNKNNKYVKN